MENSLRSGSDHVTLQKEGTCTPPCFEPNTSWVHLNSALHVSTKEWMEYREELPRTQDSITLLMVTTIWERPICVCSCS